MKKEKVEEVTEIIQPKLIGKLIKAFGIKGFVTAQIGHDVWDTGDRYMIKLRSDDGKFTELHVRFYKDIFNIFK